MNRAPDVARVDTHRELCRGLAEARFTPRREGGDPPLIMYTGTRLGSYEILKRHWRRRFRWDPDRTTLFVQADPANVYNLSGMFNRSYNPHTP